jgi:ATP-dependent Clp protease ATP-binding subunit ClpA
LFERFTERARQVVVLAQDEARADRHNYIGTEHLLLGLLREEGVAAARSGRSTYGWTRSSSAGSCSASRSASACSSAG